MLAVLALAAMFDTRPRPDGLRQDVQALQFFPTPLHGHNSRGLVCHAMRHPENVYIQPDVGSTRIMTSGVAIAVTGRDSKGFTPVILKDGSRGWMPATAIYANNAVGHLGYCYAVRHPDGTVELQYTAR